MTAARYRALLVGNRHFPEDPEHLPDLNGPHNDVASLADVLTAGPGALFRPADVELKTERKADEICAGIEQLLRDAARTDLVLLYYSGHGYRDDSQSLRLTGLDSRSGLMSRAVGTHEINAMIGRSAAAAVVVILDCCSAGAFNGRDPTAALGGQGRFVLMASQARTTASDAESATEMSRFTGHLVRGLQGEAAEPGTDHITFIDLYGYLRRKMTEEGPEPLWQGGGLGNPELARNPGWAVAPPLGVTPSLAFTGWRKIAYSVLAKKDEQAPRAVDPKASVPLMVIRRHAEAIPGLQIQPPVRSRLERTVRRAGGVSASEETLALVHLPGGAAALFTQSALYWLAKDRGVIAAALPYPVLATRTFLAVSGAPGRAPTHVDLGDGIPQLAGQGAGALAAMLNNLRTVDNLPGVA
jgi:hypothetical protein